MENLEKIEECVSSIKDILYDKDTEELTLFGEITFFFLALSLFTGIVKK